MNNPQKSSLGRKITLLNLFTIVVFCIVFGGYMLFVLNQSINTNVLESLQLTTKNVANSVNFQSNQIENNTKVFAEIVLDDFNYSLALKDKNYLINHMKGFYDYELNLLKILRDSDLGAVAIYVTYNVDELNGVYETWFVVDENNEIYEHPNESFETFNPSDPNMDWYYLPKKTGEAMWMDVYSDSQTGVKMISYVVPLYSNNNFVGVVGVDISLEGQQNYVNSTNIFTNEKIFIQDKKGEFITASEAEIEPSIQKQYLKLSKINNEGYVFGKTDTLFFKKLNNKNTILTIIPNSYKNDQLYSTAMFILVICFITIIILSFFSSILSNKIVSSIEKLQFVSRELAKGNFKIRAEVKTGDEVEELADTFNKAITALEQSEQEHKQIDKVKTEFLSITSHELRSPMTPMRAQLQMLLEGYFGKLNPKQKEAASIVLRNTERLDRILQDFLEISRIEAARLKFTFVKTTLTPHIKHVIEELRAFMPEKNVSIELKMTQLPEMEVDPDRVMQVLRNLVNNAIKFVPDEGGKILVNVQSKEGFLLFTVKDNGIGIAEENKNRIFEPFFQEEQSMYRKYQGTGLGLAICKGIIESQKGAIWFESTKGKGTTFYFTVPFTPTKEIAPIKILFSGKEMEEAQILPIFKEVLGPLGEKEFLILKNKKSISIQTVMDYVDTISKANVITSDQAKEFKNKVSVVYTAKEDREKSFVSMGNTISDDDLSFLIKGEKK